MEAAFTAIPDEVKSRLEKDGFKPFKYPALPSWMNPQRGTCKLSFQYLLVQFHCHLFQAQ